MNEVESIELFCTRTHREVKHLPAAGRDLICQIVMAQLFGVPPVIVLAAKTSVEKKHPIAELKHE